MFFAKSAAFRPFLLLTETLSSLPFLIVTPDPFAKFSGVHIPPLTQMASSGSRAASPRLSACFPPRSANPPTAGTPGRASDPASSATPAALLQWRLCHQLTGFRLTRCSQMKFRSLWKSVLEQTLALGAVKRKKARAINSRFLGKFYIRH